MATARSRAQAMECERIRQLVEDFRDRERGAGNEATALVLDQLVETLRAPIFEIVSTNERTADDPLPEVHHMDDFAEGQALIQGGMHRRAITGYTGRLGHLRGD
ncbi:MAG: hypothetical protein ACRDQZ_13150 [Mycobacteriales bacterium]